jgi:hypothetical protein
MPAHPSAIAVPIPHPAAERSRQRILLEGEVARPAGPPFRLAFQDPLLESDRQVHGGDVAVKQRGPRKQRCALSFYLEVS